MAVLLDIKEEFGKNATLSSKDGEATADTVTEKQKQTKSINKITNYGKHRNDKKDLKQNINTSIQVTVFAIKSLSQNYLSVDDDAT